MSIRAMTHEQALKELGYDLCTVVSGSMKPMLRIRKDSVLLVIPEEPLRRWDVVMYRNKPGALIMHRIVAVSAEGFWVRGDNSLSSEYVVKEQICGVMKGFYRGERYISARNPMYRLYVFCWMLAHPLLVVWKRWKRYRWRE